MPTPHQHAAAIKAWADGHAVQFRRHKDDEWKDVHDPTWSSVGEYRVKPETRALWYRCYLAPNFQNPRKSSVYAISQHTPPKPIETAELEKQPRNFTRWVSDWTKIEYEQASVEGS